MRLLVYSGHAGGRIPRAGRDALGRDRLDFLEVVARKTNIHRARVLFYARRMLRSRNRHDLIASEEPRQGELRRRAALPLRDGLNATNQRQIAVEIVRLESRVVVAPVVGGNIGRRPESAG